MKKLGILLSVAIAASSAVMLTSCGDYVGKEKTHPLFIKAGTAKNAGNYQEAAKYLEEFLTICPKSAETHFRLASLYGDNLDEPLKRSIITASTWNWLRMTPRMRMTSTVSRNLPRNVFTKSSKKNTRTIPRILL